MRRLLFFLGFVIVGPLAAIGLDAVIQRVRVLLAPSCQVVGAAFVPDVCGGRCAVGICVILTTKPYPSAPAWLSGVLGTQAASCTCPGGVAAGGTPGGTSGPPAGSTPPNVVPRQPQPNDKWCVYRVTAKRGAGAIDISLGALICIYCPTPGVTCPLSKTIVPAAGVEYDLQTSPQGASCRSCPTGTQTYQDR